MALALLHIICDFAEVHKKVFFHTVLEEGVLLKLIACPR